MDANPFENPPSNPLPLFAEWYARAQAQEVNDPDAMALATCDMQGVPDVRVVLLKGYDENGFVFYSNNESAKGIQLAAHPYAALCWHWKSLRCQIRVRGTVESVSDDMSDAYFATRGRHSRIGAWASAQSRPLARRDVLVSRAGEYETQFGEGDIPRPPYWSGWCVCPTRIEFWRNGINRLHERLAYRRDNIYDSWTCQLLFP